MTIRKRMLRHGPRTGVLAASIGALIATGGASLPAFGQDEEEEEAADASASDDAIVVTGTRIRRDDFTATNATVVVTAEDMRNLGVISVADMVNQLPANVASVSPETSGDNAFNLGASVANLRGLNTAQGSRTLVLVDSSRFIASNSNGTVDMNMIPTALVGRIETVTGGASATYGADAMAGVVNVILDNNIEGIRIDLSYDTTDEGDGDSVNLSLGTGFELFERRGQVTLGYDHNIQDAITDCTTREFCRRGMGILNQDDDPGYAGAPMSAARPFPGQPHYIITEGMRYTRLTTTITPLTTEPAVLGSYGTADAPIGTYTFSADGTQIVPYLDNLSAGERAHLVDLGTGNSGVTPWGGGARQYEGIALLPETERDNLYTRFNYDFAGGISLNASLTWSETNSVSLQDSARQTSLNLPLIYPDNGFLTAQHGASLELQALMAARTANVPFYGPLIVMGVPSAVSAWQGANINRPAPYIGMTSLDDALPNIQELYDYPEQGGIAGITKTMSDQIERVNDTNSETTNLTIGASGDLFEGGSWTWDARLNYGESERFQTITDWSSARRLEMATHSVWDPTANGGQGAVVCAIDSNAPYVQPGGFGPGLVAEEAPPGGFQTMGQYWEARWIEYIQSAINGGLIDSPDNHDLAVSYFNNIAGREGDGAPCAPFNPFGLAASPESLAFAYPTIEQRQENTQDALSVSFSGDIGEGIGAGPFRMAAGLDFRVNESLNYANPNAYTARDFANPLGVAGANFGFADNWVGHTETQEAFVEFDFPVLRDLPAADSMAFNVAFRQTENTTERLQGGGTVLTEKTDRDIESWKASMVWRPVDLMTVRATRSTDTRAPTQEELFQSNSSNLSTGFANELASYFRINFPGGPNESLDFMDTIGDGANSQLGEETSVTQTLGFVFTPTELLSGLSISVDYYETLIDGGVQAVTYLSVDDRCGQELLANGFDIGSTVYCPNIVFGEPDPTQDVLLEPGVTITNGTFNSWNQARAAGGQPLLMPGDPNPFYPYSNIETIAGSSENAQPYLSRGIDLSVSYNTQLSGGGFISARVLTSRSLEQSVNVSSGYGFFFPNDGGAFFNSGQWLDVSGQTGSNGIGSAWGSNASFYLSYTPTPRISSNMFMTYAKNAFSLTGQLRYVGTGRLNTQQPWIGPGETNTSIVTTLGPTFGQQFTYGYDTNLRSTITSNDLPSWATLNVNLSYDFSASRFSFDRFEQLQTYFNIENIGNRIPDFFSGTGAGGINTTYFSGMGRQYRVGVRMQF